MIIDSHTHFGSFGKKDWTPDQLVESMAEAGIDVSLVLANVHAGEERGTPILRILEAARHFPQLKPVGNVDFSTFDMGQEEELRQLLDARRIYGVKFYLGYDSYYPNDERFHSLYKFCSEKEFPAIFHTGALEIGFHGLLKYSHPLNIDELANSFPKLKIIMAHFGNPWVTDTAAVVAKNENVYVDLSGYFTEYQKIEQEEIDFFRKQLEEFRFFVGSFRKCLFGTDWPLYSQKEYLEAVKKLSMSDKERELVLWKNANDLFGLSDF